MNYYAPRQLKNPATGQPTGLWHYTCLNDGRVWPIGYCAGKHNRPPCHHTTELQASQCYRTYIITECKGLLPGGFALGPDTEPEEPLCMASSY